MELEIIVLLRWKVKYLAGYQGEVDDGKLIVVANFESWRFDRCYVYQLHAVENQLSVTLK